MYWEYSTFGAKTSPSLFTAENGGAIWVRSVNLSILLLPMVGFSTLSKELPSKLKSKQASNSSKIPSLSSSKSIVSGIPSPSESSESGTNVGSSI